MRRCLVAVTIGVVLGCADEGDPSAPRFEEACEDGEPARCGHGEGHAAPKSTVLVCEGGTWSEGVQCGEFSECSDDADSGAVLCEQVGNTPAIIYGEHSGNCEVAGAQACSFERDFVLVCEGGKWNIATNCSTEVQHCALQSGDFVCA